MAEYTAPYKVEGFQDPTMSTVFSDLLMITPHARRVHGSSSASTSGNDASCPSNGPQAPLTSPNANAPSPEPTSFLKAMLIEQRNTADSLMATAKKIDPVAKTIARMEDAYDAAFESDVKAPLPVAGQTLQGFALLLFFVSYVALTLVGTIAINAITKNVRITAGFFFGSFVLGMILLGVIRHLG